VNAGGTDVLTVTIEHNWIHGFRHGITSTSDLFWASANEIDSCSGNGIELHHVYSPRIVGNRIVDCANGVHMGQSGDDLYVFDNVVLRSRATGLDLFTGLVGNRITDNVVGHGVGDGIVIGLSECCTATEGMVLANNTSYSNGGSGFVFHRGTDPLPDSAFVRNIAYRNGGYGLVFDSAAPTTPSCNDWFENTLGATNGIAPGPTDVALDPAFCNVEADSVTLREDSPLLHLPGCGVRHGRRLVRRSPTRRRRPMPPSAPRCGRPAGRAWKGRSVSSHGRR